MPSKNKKETKEFSFKYVIPDHIRDCHINGAYGGVTPRNEIAMHLFNERHPIPKLETHKIKADGTLSDEKVLTKGGDAVRLIQASVIMNVETAKAICDWLNSKIKFIEDTEKNKKNKRNTITKKEK
jgi:hypothetical protein